MGYWKQYLITKNEDEIGNQIAGLLGIPYLELYNLDYELHTNNSDEGQLYNYYVDFKNADKYPYILKKINRLEKNNTVIFTQDELDYYGYEDDFYEYQFESILDNEYSKRFKEEIDNLNKLNNLEVNDPELTKILKRQIYISAIGALESFLSEMFINKVFEEESYLKKFVQTHPEFKQRKFELSNIYESFEQITETAKKIMLDTIYHDLPKVRSMYRSTFDIEFPSIGELMKIIETRHDLVHRNGKTKEGQNIIINKEAIQEIIKIIELYCHDIIDAFDLQEFNKVIKR